MEHAGKERVGPRDVATVLGLAAVLFVDSLFCPDGHFTLAAIPALALITVPLLFRSRHPRLVLLLVILGVVACLATLKPTDTVALPPMLATYTVALCADRRRSLLLALIVVPIATICVVAFSDGPPRLVDLMMNAAFMLFAVAAGDAVRSRRAYEATQRARERDREREQRAEAERLIAGERLRIAREVHDVVAHAMVAINVQAGVAAHVIDRHPGQARSALQQIKATSGEALSDLRATLGVLRDADADPDAPVRPAEGIGQVPDLAAPLRAAGVAVDVQLDGPQERVPAPVGAAAYRIAQEASTNILRHAAARSAVIAVDVGRDTVQVRVEDDGAALVPVGGAVEAGSGNGLRGMAERAAALGGALHAGRQEHGGWSVLATFPLT